jgi:hypothetical protein
MEKPINIHGKPFDELDAIKLRVQAAQYIDTHESYAVLSKSGRPLVGFISNAGTPTKVFTNFNWV